MFVSNVSGVNSIFDRNIDDDRLRRASDFMKEHYHEQVDTAHLAKVAGLSQFHFIRLFKEAYSITPHCYLCSLRVSAAKALLRNTKMPMADVAVSCGFSSQSHFGTVFRHVTGKTPTGYRKEFRANRVQG